MKSLEHIKKTHHNVVPASGLTAREYTANLSTKVRLSEVGLP